MCKELVKFSSPKGKIILDMTFGTGGHTRIFIENEAARVYALDRDYKAYKHSLQLVNTYKSQLYPMHGKFSEIIDVLSKTYGKQEFDAILFDLGVSSPQLDIAERGFSFMNDGPLDMRMNQEDDKATSAFDIVNQSSGGYLMEIIRDYGNERYARPISRAICKAREVDTISTTKQLSNIITNAIPKYWNNSSKSDRKSIHPATRTFQAIRIAVNRELDEIIKGLPEATTLLKRGGTLIAISYHSLEDKICKRFLLSDPTFRKPLLIKQSSLLILKRRKLFKTNITGHDALTDKSLPKFKLFAEKLVLPSIEEIENNPRSRSAKLRVGVKI